MATLKAGYGYWEKANYANRFRRLRTDVSVEVIGIGSRGCWCSVRLADGEVVETSADAIDE